MLRTAACSLLLATVSAGQASACPGDNREVSTDDAPTASTPCMEPVDFHVTRRAVDLSYGVGAGGTSQTGIGNIASVFGSAGLGYRLLFGDEAQPSYEVEADAGLTVAHYGGDVSATGLVTELSGHLGPARMAPSVVDDGHGSIAFFPLTMEVAHTGEISARPRMSSRPELARAQYTRERLELATRIVRVEGAGEKPKERRFDSQEDPPAVKPTSWTIDAIPLHAGVDVAMQSSSRVETTIGGAMLGVTEHESGTSLEFFGIEHQRIDLPMAAATDLDEVWMLRIDGVNPATGSRYYFGSGEVIGMPDRDELAQRLDTEHKHVYIGGLGWYSKVHPWGGWGMQYKREPFINIHGEVALESRVSAEYFCPQLLNLAIAAFAAQATRLVDHELVNQSTAGVSLDASYTKNGLMSKLGVEVGRTFYSSLDGEMPDSAGFAAGLGLSIQHTGSHTWMR